MYHRPEILSALRNGKQLCDDPHPGQIQLLNFTSSKIRPPAWPAGIGSARLPSGIVPPARPPGTFGCVCFGFQVSMLELCFIGVGNVGFQMLYCVSFRTFTNTELYMVSVISVDVQRCSSICVWCSWMFIVF